MIRLWVHGFSLDLALKREVIRFSKFSGGISDVARGGCGRIRRKHYERLRSVRDARSALTFRMTTVFSFAHQAFAAWCLRRRSRSRTWREVSSKAGAAVDDFVGYFDFIFDGHLRIDSLLGLDFVQAAFAEAGELLAGSAADDDQAIEFRAIAGFDQQRGFYDGYRRAAGLIERGEPAVYDFYDVRMDDLVQAL